MSRLPTPSAPIALALAAAAALALTLPSPSVAHAQPSTAVVATPESPAPSALPPTPAAAPPAAPPAAAGGAKKPDGPGPQSIENPGFPSAYFYKPRSGKSQKPVIVYLHGRSGVPDEGCRAWAKVATEFGWLLCPSGQEDRGHGERGWNNDPDTSMKNVMGALYSLRKKFGHRVQLYGNVLIGFSEGAFVAQNIGERDPKTFNRWLIIASCDRYFGASSEIHDKKKLIKRVYLWTGELDGAEKESEATFDHLKREGIAVKFTSPKGLPHAIPVDTMQQHFRKALKWLVSAK